MSNMDKLIGQLDVLTQQWIQQIDRLSFEQMERLVEERQVIIDLMLSELQHTTLDTGQKKRLNGVLQQDKFILERMEFLAEKKIRMMTLVCLDYML